MGHVKGAVHKLQIFGREECIDFLFSKYIRPKRSLNARLGHSKPISLDYPGFYQVFPF